MLNSHQSGTWESVDMPFRNRPNLPTSAEMRILNALWQLGAATVDQIVHSFPEGQRPNYKTTQAFLAHHGKQGLRPPYGAWTCVRV